MDKINIKYISPDPNQPRKKFDVEKLGKLKKSIEKYGIINPLVVEKIDDKSYLLVDGERRFRTALDIGLKEVPVNIVPSKDSVDRLIRQFHIQEQQEGWTPIEKAGVLNQLSFEMKIPIARACELLGIPQRTATTYIAFSALVDKETFQDQDIPMQFAPQIISTRNLAKKLSAEVLEEKFTRTDEKNLEKALMARIYNGELANIFSFSKIKNSFMTDPKVIKKFVDSDLSVKKMFEQTKAESMHALSSIQNHIRSFEIYTNKYFENPTVKPSDKLLTDIRRVIKTLNRFL